MLSDLRPLKAYCGTTEIFSDCRIRVRGRSNMTLLPDYFLVEVYNPGIEDITLLRANKKMKLQTNNMATLCVGEVEDIYSHLEGANTIYAISISDGQSFWETKASKSVGAGVYFSATIRQILMNASMGSYLAKDNRFVRPQTFNGRLADSIADIARSVHARAFISQNVLHVVEKGRSEILITIGDDDLVSDPQYATGIVIVRTIVHAWPVGMMVEFRGKRYRLATQEVNADNFQGLWQTESTLVDENFLDADGMDGG